MLHGVRQIDPAAIDARLFQRRVEETSGRTDERLALEVLLVTGLLAHQHQARVLAAFAENGLGRALPQVAGPARGRGLPQLLDISRHSSETRDHGSNWE